MSDALQAAMHAALEIGGSTSALNEGEQLVYAAAMKAAFAQAQATADPMALPYSTIEMSSVSNKAVKVSVLSATKIADTDNAMITYKVTSITSRLVASETTKTITISKGDNNWLAVDMMNRLPAISPSEFDIKKGGRRTECYCYDDWVCDQMTVYHAFKEHGVLSKRRRIAPNSNSDANEINFDLDVFWAVPLKRFCSLIDAAIWPSASSA
jgi:hypothetical protein